MARLGGIQVFLEAGNTTIPDFADDTGGHGKGAADRFGLKDVLLHKAAGDRDPALNQVTAVPQVLRHPAQDTQVFVDGLFEAIVVVPDARVWGVDRTDGLDVAGLYRAEEALGDGEGVRHGIRR